MFDKLFRLGTNSEMPAHTRVNIKLTHQVMLILITFTLIVILTSLGNKRMLEHAIIYFALALGSELLLIAGFHRLARFIISVVAMGVAVHGALVSRLPGDTFLGVAYMLPLSLLALPFVIFNYTERVLIFTVLVLDISLLAAMGELLHIVEPEPLSEAEHQIQQISGFVFSISILLGSLMLFLDANRQSTLRFEKTIQQLSAKQHEMQEAENALKATLSELEAARNEERKRAWVAQGVEELNAIIRQYSQHDNLYERLLSALTSYADALYGGLFLVAEDHEGEYLTLKSCYAGSRQKFLELRIEKGQGLAGQCWYEGKPIHQPVPPDYVLVFSGLGRVAPSEIYLCPFIYNGHVEAILEVADVKPIASEVRSYLDASGEVIAALMATRRIDTHTRKLLEASQQHQEMLRMQEEVMRQNFEEMQATQEEMGRKEKEYLQRIEELEAALATSRVSLQ
jgi:hypothetical protein